MQLIRSGTKTRSSTKLHVRAFADSNNDGIGDFPGLISKLDYLQDLGITCIWLLPVLPFAAARRWLRHRKLHDVNPSYGTLSDFKDFLGCGASAQHAGDDRAGHQPHQRSASVVQSRAHWRRPVLLSATCMCGRSPTRSTKMRASSSQTQRNQTGHGTRPRKPITGTVSFRISRI